MPKEHRTGTGRRQEEGLDWRKLEFKKRNLCKKRGRDFALTIKLILNNLQKKMTALKKKCSINSGTS